MVYHMCLQQSYFIVWINEKIVLRSHQNSCQKLQIKLKYLFLFFSISLLNLIEVVPSGKKSPKNSLKE